MTVVDLRAASIYRSGHSTRIRLPASSFTDIYLGLKHSIMMVISISVVPLFSLALVALSTPTQPWYPQKQGKSLQIVAKEITSDTLQYHFYVWPQGTAVDVCNTTPIEAHGGFTDGVEYADINDTPFLQDEVSGKFDGGDCKYINNAIDSPGQLSCASWGVGVTVDCKAEAEKGHVTHNDCWDGQAYQRVVYCEW